LGLGTNPDERRFFIPKQSYSDLLKEGLFEIFGRSKLLTMQTTALSDFCDGKRLTNPKIDYMGF
jgi:hypothetical protein